MLFFVARPELAISLAREPTPADTILYAEMGYVTFDVQETIVVFRERSSVAKETAIFCVLEPTLAIQMTRYVTALVEQMGSSVNKPRIATSVVTKKVRTNVISVGSLNVAIRVAFANPLRLLQLVTPDRQLL